jgi:hypothetical protein
MFLRIYNAMTIYGVKDRDDQERILRSLTTYKKQTSILPVRVSFFAAEIWIEQSDEKGVLRRGYETPIRVATVGRPFWPVD